MRSFGFRIRCTDWLESEADRQWLDGVVCESGSFATALQIHCADQSAESLRAVFR